MTNNVLIRAALVAAAPLLAAPAATAQEQRIVTAKLDAVVAGNPLEDTRFHE